LAVAALYLKGQAAAAAYTKLALVIAFFATGAAWIYQ
jgi:hypothetical protein